MYTPGLVYSKGWCIPWVSITFVFMYPLVQCNPWNGVSLA
jgi:hypothetical protein